MAFDPVKHPRWPKGSPKGGEFMHIGDLVHFLDDAEGVTARIKAINNDHTVTIGQWGTDAADRVVPVGKIRALTAKEEQKITRDYARYQQGLGKGGPKRRGPRLGDVLGVRLPGTDVRLTPHQDKVLQRMIRRQQATGLRGTARRFIGLDNEMPADLQLAGAISARSAASGAPGDAMGKIRNIVMSAHKWGGDGKRPIFRKIRARLVAEHPEVIAKAFGGDPNKAAGWVKARWYQLRGRKPPATTGKHALSQDDGEWNLEDGYELLDHEDAERIADEVTHELFCADDGQTQTQDGLVWKTLARTGTWKISPKGDGKPLVLDETLFDDVVDAFNNGAWENVTVPLSHKDRPDENTGFVKQVIKVEDPARPGEYKLRGGIKFTEPEIEGKVTRGTIANCSIGVDLRGVKRTSDGTKFPRVLKHVALTNAPWLDGLDPFGSTTLSYEHDEEPDFDAFIACAKSGWEPDLELADDGAVWDSGDDWIAMEEAARDALGKYRYDDDAGKVIEKPSSDRGVDIASPGRYISLSGMKDGKLLATAGYGNSAYGWVVPYTYSDGEVEVGAPDEWERVEKEWVAAAMDEEADLYLASFTADDRKKLAAKGQAMKGGGFPIRNISDLKNAIQAFGRAKDKAAAKAHIIKRARALKATYLLPEGWAKLAAAKDGGRVVLRLHLGGGDKVADTDEGTETIELTKDELTELISEEAKRIAAGSEVKLSKMQARLREADVKGIVRELEEKGHAAAFVKRAEELLLAAPADGEAILTLSREADEDGGEPVEEQLTVDDIILSLAEAIPPTSLNLDQPKARKGGTKPAEDATTKSARERADALWNDIRGGESSSLAASEG